MILELSLAAGESLEPVGSLPKTIDYQVHELNVSKLNRERLFRLEIVFSVYINEPVRLPALQVGNITLPSILLPAPVSQLNNSNLRELLQLNNKPLSLPWVDLSIAILIQIMIILPILIFQILRRIRKFWQSLVKRWKEKQPYYRLQKQIHLLQNNDELPTVEYYRILSSQLRYYLSARTSQYCISLTSEELKELDFPLKNEVVWQEVLSLMYHSDQQRFSSGELLSMPRSEHPRKRELSLLLDFAKKMEKVFYA